MTMMTLMCSTGIVVDVGYTECCATPVIEGITLVDCIKFSDLGSRAIHDRIRSNLIDFKSKISHNGRPFSFDLDELGGLSESVIEDIKVRTCFIPSFSRGQDLIKARIENRNPENVPKDVLYSLEGRKALNIPGILRESSAQVLFEPQGNESTVSSLIMDVIEQCPVDSRKTLASNIILTGGTTMITGFKRRIKKELEQLVLVRNMSLASSSFKLHSLPCPANYSSWLGGAIFGSTEATSSILITKKQLETPTGFMTTEWNLWTPN
jgi:actin-related protein 10